jgi:hypothetical protein
MDPFERILNLIGCIAMTSFFTAFVLTFWPSRMRLVFAAILYGVGIIACQAPYAYLHFAQGATWTFGRFPILEWLLPTLLLLFAIAAALLLWPFIPQKIAFKCGIVLFFGVAPVLIFLKLLPEYLQFHWLLRPFDLTWLLYAILWFRIRETFQKQKAPKILC